MPYNGTGTFSRLYSWVADAASAIAITASRMDADTNDIVTSGLNNALTRDGQGQPSANLPMAGFRHTGAGNAVGSGDYVTLGQATGGGVAFSGTTITASSGLIASGGGATITGNSSITGNLALSGTIGATGGTLTAVSLAGAITNAGTVNGGTISGAAITGGSVGSLASPLAVGSGGTGLTTLASGSIPIGAGTSAFTALSPSGQSGKVVGSNGSAFVFTTTVFSSTFTSTAQSIPALGATLSVAHGLSSAPFGVFVVMTCTSAELCWSNGDSFFLAPGVSNGNTGTGDGITVYADATNVKVILGTSGIWIMNKSTGAESRPTYANWTWTIKAWL